MSSTIGNFKRSWAHTRGLTHDFIAAVPDEHWEFSPHPRFASFAKQVRHLVCMSGVYSDGLRDRRCDFGRKHEHYKGPLDRDSLVAALREKDRQLDEVLAAISPEAEESYVIDFYGLHRHAPEMIYDRLPEMILKREGCAHEIAAADDSLEAVFEYLTDRS